MTETVILSHQTDFNGWQEAVRGLIAHNICPSNVVWSVGRPSNDLFSNVFSPFLKPEIFRVPRSFVELARLVIQARSPERFALLYKILWRIKQGESHLMHIVSDADISKATAMAKAVRRDRHKMRAFLRFRQVVDKKGEYYAAWFEPDHYIVDSNASFFVKRFSTIEWLILTPDRSAHWNGTSLSLGEGAHKSQIPPDDQMADYWQIYFTNIFNPARLKSKAMLTEMPKKFWKNMPETAHIRQMVSSASQRTQDMIQLSSKLQPVPTK